MKIVIALGGNAILQRKEPLEADIQKKNVIIASQCIAEVAKTHKVIVTHGNGPQVGLLALQNDAYKDVSPYPLDVLGAETEGMIGYLLLQQLKNRLPENHVAALLTQTLVDKDDPAFENPNKFVGPIYSSDESKKLAQEKNWVFKKDGDDFRRVVPSPQPKKIIEEDIIYHLSNLENTTIICAGGGGVPVCYNQNNQLTGVEAVVDKDNASCLVAQSLDADAFIMLTDVPAVETHFNQTDSKQIKLASPEHLLSYQFPDGSMGPKVDSAIRFIQSGGKIAMIGALSDLSDILRGKAGTKITSECKKIVFY